MQEENINTEEKNFKMSLSKDTKIDPSQLHYEWAELPELYRAYSEEIEYIEDEIKKAKFNFELKMAELDKEIRSNPEKYTDKEKPTEGQIKAVIISTPEIKDSQYAIFEKEKIKKLLKVGCNSLEMKKDAMKQIQGLLTSEYFTTTTSDIENYDFTKKQEEISNRNIKKLMKKRARRHIKKEKEDE